MPEWKPPEVTSYMNNKSEEHFKNRFSHNTKCDSIKNSFSVYQVAFPKTSADLQPATKK
jgi:hypothetical protein